MTEVTLEEWQGDRIQSRVLWAQLRSPDFVLRVSGSHGGFQAGE